MIFFRILRKLIFKVGFYYYVFKCELLFFSNHASGLSYVIQYMPHAFIIPILRKYGATVGERCQIDTGIILHRIRKKEDIQRLEIGDHVYVGHNMIFDLSDKITIGNHCGFGANCQIWTHVGDYTYSYDDYFDRTKEVKVDSGVVVYSGSIISPGITIGQYARVLAGSVVTKDIESKCVAGGVPAKVIKKRDI